MEGNGESDPGYDEIMETTGISWWNVNPIYVPRPQAPHAPPKNLAPSILSDLLGKSKNM